MGYIRHHAIIVTGTYDDWADKAHRQARKMFGAGNLSPVCEKQVNGAESFVVFPDGSKEGWEATTAGDDQRAAFIKWLRAQAYDDGSSPLAWVEVQYGDDNRETKVTAHSDDQGQASHAKEGAKP